jgi:hypothetical protein
MISVEVASGGSFEGVNRAASGDKIGDKIEGMLLLLLLCGVEGEFGAEICELPGKIESALLLMLMFSFRSVAISTVEGVGVMAEIFVLLLLLLPLDLIFGELDTFWSLGEARGDVTDEESGSLVGLARLLLLLDEEAA